MKTMTKQEFIQFYADGSSMTPELIEEIGLTAVPCDCGKDMCSGWQMLHKSQVEE